MRLIFQLKIYIFNNEAVEVFIFGIFFFRLFGPSSHQPIYDTVMKSYLLCRGQIFSRFPKVWFEPGTAWLFVNNLIEIWIFIKMTLCGARTVAQHRSASQSSILVNDCPCWKLQNVGAEPGGGAYAHQQTAYNFIIVLDKGGWVFRILNFFKIRRPM